MKIEAPLPTSWVECTLGEVIDYGSTRKVEPSAIPDDAWLLELEDIEKDTSRILQRITFANRKSKSTKNQFTPGDVLYGKLRPYLNKVVRPGESGYCSTEIVPLSPPLGIDSGYLFHWLKHPRFLEYVTSVSHGLNMPRLGTAAGKAAPFVLAPFHEQERIANKLDATLARVGACRDHLDRIPTILKRFRQAVLAAATSGELTREWREERGLPCSRRTFMFDDDTLDVPGIWDDAALGELLEPTRPLCYGVVQPGEEVPGGPLLVRIQDLGNGTVMLDGLRTIAFEVDRQYHRSRVRAKDVLVSVVGTIGRVAVVPEGFEGNIARAIARLACGSRVLPEWIQYWLERDVVQWWLVRTSREVARKTLNLSELATTQIAVPSLEEQAEIVRRTRELLEFASLVEQRVASADVIVDSLTPSFLAKAFRGDLVLQDTQDEPASELLIRLKAQQSATEAEPPQRRKRAPGKKRLMSDTNKDAIKAAILKLKAGNFSFDELRAQVPGDYESLKDAVFELLEEPTPVVRQVFDKKARIVGLVRVRP